MAELPADHRNERDERAARGERPAAPAGAPRRSEAHAVQTTQPRRLSAGRKVLFALLTTAVFFGLLEFLLYCAGVETVAGREDPYVGFAGYNPLFVKQDEAHGETLLTTADSKLVWFNSQSFAARKPDGVRRVFCLGGSTTYGRPYDDSTSFCGWLRELLPKADTSTRWEVINAGGISYASYRVARVMEELVDYEPDLFVVYCGHNEFLERRTYAELLETPGAIRDASSLLGRTRTFSLIRRWTKARAAESSDSQPVSPADAENLLPAEVESLLDNAIGPDAYHRDAEFRAGVLAHFRFNLEHMLQIAEQAGAAVVLVVPACNLRDCTPFKSENAEGLSTADLARWQSLAQQAETALAEDRLEAALAAAEEAAGIDARHADLQFLHGQILLKLGRTDEAAAAFTRARDEDVCPLRAVSEILDIVRDVGEDHAVTLVDFERLVTEQSEDGIPGEDWFLDHVHPTIPGHRALALAILETLDAQGQIAFGSEWSEGAVEQVTERIEQSVDPRDHAVALRNLAKVLGWAGKQQESARLALRALDLLPDDPEAQYEAGNACVEMGQLQAAIVHFQAALELDAQFPRAHYGLGLAHQELGELSEAADHYRQALQLDPNFANAHYNLGCVLEAQGEVDRAARQYEEALRINPRDFYSLNNLGVLAMRQGQIEKGRRYFEQALAANPRHADAHLNLAMYWKRAGDFDTAITECRAALHSQPDHVLAAFQLALMLVSHPETTKRRPDEAVALARRCAELSGDPTPQLFNLLAVTHAAAGRFGEAIRWQQQALQRVPPAQRGPLEQQLQRFQHGQPAY